MATNRQLRIFRTLDELEAVRPAWEDLARFYPAATTFCTWEWLSCWWRSFGETRTLLVLALFDSESLLGLAAFAIAKERLGPFSLRTLRLMGDGSGDSDNLDFPARPGSESDFADAIYNYLRENRKEWDICQFNTLPPASEVSHHLGKRLTSAQWTSIQSVTASSAIYLPGTWNEYLERLSTEDRKNLARYTRRLERRYELRTYRCMDEVQLPRCLDALFTLHQRRWRAAGQAGAFCSTERREFYRHLASALLKKQQLQLWVMDLDGEIAAVQFAFRFGDRVFQLQEGYDCTLSSDRVGFVLRGAVLQRLIAENVRVYDFLGGDDGYKRRWGAEVGSYQNLHFAPALSLGGVMLKAASQASNAKRRLRRNLPASIWKVLRGINALLHARPSSLDAPPSTLKT